MNTSGTASNSKSKRKRVDLEPETPVSPAVVLEPCTTRRRTRQLPRPTPGQLQIPPVKAPPSSSRRASPPAGPSSPPAPASGSTPVPNFTSAPAPAPAPAPAIKAVDPDVIDRWLKSGQEFYCSQCVIPFAGNESCYGHLTIGPPHGNKATRCPECAVSLPNLKTFKKHVEDTSHMSIPGRAGLVISDSMTRLIGVSAFTTKGCPHCKLQVPDDPRLKELRKHMVLEHYCRWCKQVFISRESRERHYHGQHAVCPSCRQPFSTKESLFYHQAQHQAKFPGCLQVPDHHQYRCLICWESIFGLENLMRHRAIHRCYTREYTCDDCDYSGSLTLVRTHVIDTGHMEYHRAPAPANTNAQAGPSTRD